MFTSGECVGVAACWPRLAPARGWAARPRIHAAQTPLVVTSEAAASTRPAWWRGAGHVFVFSLPCVSRRWHARSTRPKDPRESAAAPSLTEPEWGAPEVRPVSVLSAMCRDARDHSVSCSHAPPLFR